MSLILADTHVLHWWTAEPERLSSKAIAALRGADEIGLAAISWWELAWLATHERIFVSIPVRSWLERLSEAVRTVQVTPAIAAGAAALPSSFPRDAADRLIFATAQELGCQLVTKDQGIRAFRAGRSVAVW